MKTILLFGAGKSASVLIKYLEDLANSQFCKIIIADADFTALQKKVTAQTLVEVFEIDILKTDEREQLIEKADVVISLMPPNLHYLIALNCIKFKKHLLTASYIDEIIRVHEDEIKNAGILFLYEMGLDPGIDHMSAMQLIHKIENKNGNISSFSSHCGGLISLKSDNNPWHYKISWNPRNVVLAGKAGAQYFENETVINRDYEHLFKNCKQVEINNLGILAYYPNRDCISYKNLYGLKTAKTFIRTTLRHPEFCKGWQIIIDFKLTDETPFYKTDGLTVTDFLEVHLKRFDLDLYYQNITDELLTVQMNFLFNNNAIINKGFCSAADVLQFILQDKLLLETNDHDMIVMQHEIEYHENELDKKITSTLIVEGDDNIKTAMAKTVGLPLGIAAKLILEGKIKIIGLHIPIIKEIYEPVMQQLKQNRIEFLERETAL